VNVNRKRGSIVDEVLLYINCVTNRFPFILSYCRRMNAHGSLSFDIIAQDILYSGFVFIIVGWNVDDVFPVETGARKRVGDAFYCRKLLAAANTSGVARCGGDRHCNCHKNTERYTLIHTFPLKKWFYFTSDFLSYPQRFIFKESAS
jgi:hypothetical protein